MIAPARPNSGGRCPPQKQKDFSGAGLRARQDNGRQGRRLYRHMAAERNISLRLPVSDQGFDRLRTEN